MLVFHGREVVYYSRGLGAAVESGARQIQGWSFILSTSSHSLALAIHHLKGETPKGRFDPLSVPSALTTTREMGETRKLPLQPNTWTYSYPPPMKPFQTKQRNRPSCRHQEGRRGSAEAVLGTSMFFSSETGVSGWKE